MLGGMPIVSQPLGDWIVDMEWREGDYQGGPAAVWIRPADPDAVAQGGISSTVLRAVDFRKAKAELQSQVDPDTSWMQAVRQRNAAHRVQELRAHLAIGVTPDYLALLASEYLSRINSGVPKPVERLAGDLGKAMQTVQGHLWQARKTGLLLGSAGRKGGELSDEANSILLQLRRRPPLTAPPQSLSLVNDEPPAGMDEDSSSDR